MGRYDCFLNTDVVSHDRNAELTIILRIFFQQGSGTVSDITGITRQARPWPSSEWQGFKRRITTESMRLWNGKFWLIPPSNTTMFTWTGGSRVSALMRQYDPIRSMSQTILGNSDVDDVVPQSGSAIQTNIYCKFRIEETDTASNAHLTLRGDYLGRRTDGFYTNSVGDGQGIFQSGVLNEYTFPGQHRHSTVRQRQYLHEIGHAIGQRHVGFVVSDSTCSEVNPASGTHNQCYVGRTWEDENNVMGSGTRLREENAISWVHALSHITHIDSSQFRVRRQRVFPTRVGTIAPSITY